MLRILPIFGLVLLTAIVSQAKGATYCDPDPQSQPAPAEASALPPHQPPANHRCLVPGPQPGTYLRGQPYAYGYFGAHAQPSAAFHRSNNDHWCQWTVYRSE